MSGAILNKRTGINGGLFRQSEGNTTQGKAEYVTRKLGVIHIAFEKEKWPTLPFSTEFFRNWIVAPIRILEAYFCSVAQQRWFNLPLTGN